MLNARQYNGGWPMKIRNPLTPWSSLAAQRVKDRVLSLQWLRSLLWNPGSNPSHRTPTSQRKHQKKKKKKERTPPIGDCFKMKRSLKLILRLVPLESATQLSLLLRGTSPPLPPHPALNSSSTVHGIGWTALPRGSEMAHPIFCLCPEAAPSSGPSHH